MGKERGKLIIIEGTDASGKETQTKMLVNRLTKEEIPTKTMSFPRYETPTGRIIGQAYLGKEKEEWKGDSLWFGDPNKVDPILGSLYYAADRFSASKDITKILNAGTNLILDRYYYSNMAHQGAKMSDKSKRGAFFDFIKKLELELLKIPEEEKVIFLHMPAEVALDLIKKRKEKPDGHENINHLKMSEEVYLHLSEHYHWNWEKIDCIKEGNLRTIEDIHEEIYNHVKKIINQNK